MGGISYPSQSYMVPSTVVPTAVEPVGLASGGTLQDLRMRDGYVTRNLTVAGDISTQDLIVELNSPTPAAQTQSGFVGLRLAANRWVILWDEANTRFVMGTATANTVATTTPGLLRVQAILVPDATSNIAAGSEYFIANASGAGIGTASGGLGAGGLIGWCSAFTAGFGVVATQFTIGGGMQFGWTSAPNGSNSQNADTAFSRLAAASLRLGLAPSATPIAQTFTIGEASRPGTDTDIAGASGTVRSGLGTGTGAASSLVFQTPTLVASGSTTQTYATRLTIATAAVTSTVPVLAAAGSITAPSLSFSSGTARGLAYIATTGTVVTIPTFCGTGADDIQFACANNTNAAGSTAGFSLTCPNGWEIRFRTNQNNGYFEITGNTNSILHRWYEDDYLLASGGILGWSSESNYATAGNGARDLGVGRLAAASLRLGLAPSASPIAQTFTIGESSRPGTDTNVGGGAATLRPGLGTGTGVAPKFAIQGVQLVASGSTTQTYTDMIAVTGVALGLYGVTPTVRAGAISAPTTPGVIYSQAEAQSMETAVNAIRVALTNLGVTA